MKSTYKIIHNGEPKLKNMGKIELNVFCKSLLDLLIADVQQSKRLLQDNASKIAEAEKITKT